MLISGLIPSFGLVKARENEGLLNNNTKPDKRVTLDDRRCTSGVKLQSSQLITASVISRQTFTAALPAAYRGPEVSG